MNVNELEQSLAEYNSLYEQGQITPAEYSALLQGLEVEKAIAEGVEDLEKKEQLNKIVTAAIAAASLLG